MVLKRYNYRISVEHQALNQWCFKVDPPSATLAQHLKAALAVFLSVRGKVVAYFVWCGGRKDWLMLNSVTCLMVPRRVWCSERHMTLPEQFTSCPGCLIPLVRVQLYWTFYLLTRVFTATIRAIWWAIVGGPLMAQWMCCGRHEKIVFSLLDFCKWLSSWSTLP